MLLDLSWLKAHPKEAESFSFQEQIGAKDLGGNVKLTGDLQVVLSLTNTGRLYVGNGVINAWLDSECARCLKRFQEKMSIPFDLQLCPEEYRSHFLGSEEEITFFNEPEFDLEPFVLENIIVNLPFRSLCTAECKGLCPRCGVDLNENQCFCRDDEIDPRWEALKKML